MGRPEVRSVSFNTPVTAFPLTTRCALTRASRSLRGLRAEPREQPDGLRLGAPSERWKRRVGRGAARWRMSLRRKEKAQEADPSLRTGLL